MSKRVGLLSEVNKYWEDEWQGMPEFIQNDLQSFKSIIVHFKDINDLKDFAKLVEQNIGIKTKSIWYPKLKLNEFKNKRCIDEEQEQKRPSCVRLRRRG